MAKIRGGSTVGGKQIVTLDVMNEFIYQIQTAELEDKMRKAEKDTVLNSFTQADTFIKDRNKNGLWEMSNATNNDNKYNYGGLMNFSNNNSRFQIYAPHKEGSVSAMYFRTGWGNETLSWERISTKSMLDSGLNLKYDKTGGDINGNILASGIISTRNQFQVVNSSNDFVRESIDASACKFSTSNGISSYSFDKDIKTTGEMYALTNNKVWHSGNFNPSDYVAKNATSLANGTNLDTVKTSGYYVCSAPANAPSKVTSGYIEVVAYGTTKVLQKIYSFDGQHSYSRIMDGTTWSFWRTMNGTLSFTQNITTSSWSEVDGAYEMNLTHNLGTENLTSVIVTDSNKVSMFTGFQVISTTTIKVFCSSSVAGKIVINATH